MPDKHGRMIGPKSLCRHALEAALAVHRPRWEHVAASTNDPKVLAECEDLKIPNIERPEHLFEEDVITGVQWVWQMCEVYDSYLTSLGCNNDVKLVRFMANTLILNPKIVREAIDALDRNTDVVQTVVSDDLFQPGNMIRPEKGNLWYFPHEF